MKIFVNKLVGDAVVLFFNKQGDLIHNEEFYSKEDSQYIRELPVSEVEYGSTKALYSGEFEYKVIS